MKRAILIATGIIALGITACKKDDNGKVVTNVDLISSATWKIDTIGFDNDGNGKIDNAVPGGFKTCELDNTIKFSADSTGVLDEGAAKCTDTDPQSSPFTWSFKDNDKTIHIEGAIQQEFVGDTKVLELTNTTLVLAKAVNITDPIPFASTLIISLKK